MAYTVIIKKNAQKNVNKMPANEKKKFEQLVYDLELKGPIRKDWPNFSSLGKNEYHCHLSHHWVVCWRHEKERIVIEVYYAGSRENGPY